MNKFYLLRLIVATGVWCLACSFPLFADNQSDYETRREAFIQTALANFNGDAITLQAYKGLPVDQPALTSLLNHIQSSAEADFGIVKLVRVLFFSNGEYDAQILPVLQNIPFWLEANEEHRVYWSENHMIMWTGSAYLLKQKYGWAMDSTVEARLKHFLELKVNYGFYEFFSSVYAPYTLSGLLNVADFATDPEIKSLAIQASQRLLKDFMILANDKGTYFPVAGRNYYPKYTSPYNQNHSRIIYLLTGFGEVPNSGSHASNFLASSTVPVIDAINFWRPVLDTTYRIGHTLQQGFVLNSGMTFKDKVIFQFSSGAYFHPDVAQQTAQLIKDLNLWNHSQFDDFEQFMPILSALPVSFATTLANIASPISKSSVICGQDVTIYKNKSVTLSSIHDFWKGKLGYQEHPCVANVGTTCVMPASGKILADWEDRDESNLHVHLPYVDQKQNVALIMYRPEKLLSVFGFGEKLDVGLIWDENDFDEQAENGMWLIGREENSYIAVRRNCTGMINGQRGCSNPDGQTWVMVVGNSDLHGSFENFKSIISQAQYEERWYFNLPTLQWVYYAKVVVDGKTLEYAWNGDLFSGPTQTPTGLFNPEQDVTALNVFPNPAISEVNIDLSVFDNQPVSLRIHNMIGQEVFFVSGLRKPMEKINIENWNKGVYIISVESEDKKGAGKFVIGR